MRILIVEDDEALLETLTTGLRAEGLEVATAATYATGHEHGSLGSFGLIVLDVMLPGGSGFQLCSELRRANVTTPILMLTARDTVDDKVSGLEAGADDYLIKPFAFRELLARIRALTRRQPSLLGDLVRVADLEVDLRSHTLRRDGRDIPLTAKEFALLECFVRHPGAVLDRGTITASVWDDNHDPLANALEVLVRRLRSKIDDPFPVKLIHTLRGAGYRFGI